MKFWFVPCWSGDFRLEVDKKDKDRCVLTVENPTDADRERLRPFLTAARRRKWISSEDGLSTTGKSEIPVKAPMHVAGALLAEKAIPDGEVWTAVRHTDGTVTVENGTRVAEPEKAEVAASVAKPDKGCPEPVACLRREAEVLRAFCTKPQWAQFQTYGFMQCVGNITGKTYHVFHRDEAAQRGMNRSVWDVEAQSTVCVYNKSLPPEEEALALKLAIEHREAWLLGLVAANAGDGVRSEF